MSCLPWQVRIGFFNSHGEALITLVRVLVGEGWHEVTFAVLNARGSFIMFLYFGAAAWSSQWPTSRRRRIVPPCSGSSGREAKRAQALAT